MAGLRTESGVRLVAISRKETQYLSSIFIFRLETVCWISRAPESLSVTRMTLRERELIVIKIDAAQQTTGINHLSIAMWQGSQFIK